MENNQRITVINLARAFAGESQARTRYTVYADTARNEGKEWIARVFEEIAANEAVHAKMFLQRLKALEPDAANIDLAAGYPFQMGTRNLRKSPAGRALMMPPGCLCRSPGLRASITIPSVPCMNN